MKWLGPSTPEAIQQAANDGVGVIVTPVAFVSEHIETLVELDIEYAELAHGLGVAPYLRSAAVGVAAPFIQTLSDAVLEALPRDGVAPYGPGCRAAWKACPAQCSRKAA
jgi:ferrochelatase